MRRSPEEYESLEPLASVAEFCEVVVTTFDERDATVEKPCGREILTMAYKGTGACGEEHLKIKTRDYGTQDVGVNPTGEC